MHSVTDIDDVSCSSFDLPIVASWRSIIKGYSLFCSSVVCKMAASINNIVTRQQRQSWSADALNYSAMLPWVGNIRDAVFDRCQRRRLMMESVGWYAHQLRDTHPPLVPPLRLHDTNAPFWHPSSQCPPSGKAYRVIYCPLDRWISGCMLGCMDGRTDAWIVECMHGRMKPWMDGLDIKWTQ